MEFLLAEMGRTLDLRQEAGEALKKTGDNIREGFQIIDGVAVDLVLDFFEAERNTLIAMEQCIAKQLPVIHAPEFFETYEEWKDSAETSAILAIHFHRCFFETTLSLPHTIEPGGQI